MEKYSKTAAEHQSEAVKKRQPKATVQPLETAMEHQFPREAATEHQFKAATVLPLETAMARSGLSDGSLITIRHPKRKFLLATTGRERSQILEDSNKLDSCSEKAKEHLQRGTKCFEESIFSLRAESPHDNRFLFVAEEDRDLRLRMGSIDPRPGGIGLFRRACKMCRIRKKFEYVCTYTNLKHNKTIAVQPGKTPSVVLMNPMEPLSCDDDARVFVRIKSRGLSILLEPTEMMGNYLSFTESGEVIISPTGSPLVENNGTPVCVEYDMLNRFSNLSLRS